jgi:DNA primase
MTNDLIESIEREIFNRSTGDFFSKDDEIKFLCPAHKDTNPSARWNQKKHVWYCDACGTGGGCIDLAKRLGIKTPVRTSK